MTVTELQVAANWYVSKGWSINTMTDQHFTASKKRAHGLATWIIALVFFPIGLLAFLYPGPDFAIVLADQATDQLRNAQTLDAEESKAKRTSSIVWTVILLILLAAISYSCLMFSAIGN